MSKRIPVILLVLIGCSVAGPRPHADADSRPVPVADEIRIFDKTFPADAKILLVSKAKDPGHEDFANHCQALLVKRATETGWKLYDQEVLTRVWNAAKYEAMMERKSNEEITALLAEYRAAALVTVWVDAVSTESAGGRYRGDARLSIVAQDSGGQYFGAWTNPLASPEEPYAVKETALDAKIAALNHVTNLAAVKLGMSVDGGSGGSGGSGGDVNLNLGKIQFGQAIGKCLAVTMDEKGGRVYAIAGDKLLVRSAKSLAPVVDPISLPCTPNAAAFCVQKGVVFVAEDDEIHVVSLATGKVTQQAEADDDVVCAAAAPTGEACFGLADGSVALLKVGGSIRHGSARSEDIRAVGFAGGARVLAEVSVPDSGDFRIALRTSDGSLKGTPILKEHEVANGVQVLHEPKAVSIGGAGDVIVVAIRTKIRSISSRGSRRPRIEGGLVVVNVEKWFVSKQLEGKEFADVNAVSLHPRYARWAAIGNRYEDDEGILALVDIFSGRTMDQLTTTGIMHVAFSEPDGNYLCGQDALGRLFYVPVR